MLSLLCFWSLSSWEVSQGAILQGAGRLPKSFYGHSIKAGHLGDMLRAAKMPLLPPSHFLSSYLHKTWKLPLRLQTFELLIWQIWVSTTHYLTF